MVDLRLKELERWTRAELGEVRLEPLPVEASSRRFFRAYYSEGNTAATLIAMDAPPTSEDNNQFVSLSQTFRRAGVPVPEVLRYDAKAGFLLVTDFGSRHLRDVYETPERDTALALAVDMLPRIQALPARSLPPYTVQRLRDELGIFREWLLDGLLGIATPTFFAKLCDDLIAATQEQPQVPVHRDYHSRNLLLRDRGTLGIVDFQDALVGPLTYDLVSLLRDCYYEFDERTVQRFQERYLAAAERDVEPTVFQRWFDLTGIQRQLKAVGIFARLDLRDSRSSHLGEILPVVRRIQTLAERFEETRALADWLQHTVAPAAAQKLGSATAVAGPQT